MRKMDYSAFVEVLKDRKATLSPRLQDVAQFVLNNPEDVAILTIVEIAKASGVPPSTVTRFTQELGLERFSELQSIFRERLIGPRLSYTDRLKVISKRVEAGEGEGPLDLSDPHAVLDRFSSSAHSSLMQVVEDQRTAPLPDFVEELRAAPIVHIVGGRGAYGVAAYSFYGLATVGKRVFLIDNLGSMRHQQIQAIGPGEVLLAISFDDYTAETIECAKEADNRGLTVLAITDNELSPLIEVAKHALFVKEARHGHFRSQVPAMVLCQSIIASVGRSGDRSIGKT